MILDGDDDTLSDKIGCPLYTAPELLCPQPTYQGKPADMWSLGVILYTMLVGQYPFYEKANCNLITVIRHGVVQIPLSLSKSVRWLILALLRKDYTERMTASHIFLTPWLKEQRPFHLYLPVDVEIADDWEGGEEDQEEEDECMEEGDVSELCPLSGEKHEHDYEDIGVEPLDYTHNTLQMAQSNSSSTSFSSSSLTTETEADADEDMGWPMLNPEPIRGPLKARYLVYAGAWDSMFLLHLPLGFFGQARCIAWFMPATTMLAEAKAAALFTSLSRREVTEPDTRTLKDFEASLTHTYYTYTYTKYENNKHNINIEYW